MLEKVDQLVLILDLDLLEESLINVFTDNCKVTVCEALNGSGTGFIVD